MIRLTLEAFLIAILTAGTQVQRRLELGPDIPTQNMDVINRQTILTIRRISTLLSARFEIIITAFNSTRLM